MDLDDKYQGKSTETKIVDEENQCHQCFKIFSSKSGKAEHIRHVHENIRNFKCETCDKAFHIRSTLVWKGRLD